MSLPQQRTHEETVRPFFVYGSLLSGLHNHSLISSEIAQITSGHVRGVSLYANGRMFPYAIKDGYDLAKGEIITVRDEDFDLSLKRLDSLEGYRGQGNLSNHYDRIVVTALTDEGKKIECWMYVAAPWLVSDIQYQYPKVSSGDWRSWVKA